MGLIALRVVESDDMFSSCFVHVRAAAKGGSWRDVYPGSGVAGWLRVTSCRQQVKGHKTGSLEGLRI